MCIDCVNGQYAPATGHGACLNCPSGKYARTGHTTCFHCPRGKFSYDTANAECDNCAPGQHQALTVASNCAGCPTGRYQHLWGKYFCYGCPEGKYNEQVGATFCPACDHCTHSGNVASSCYSLAIDCRVSQWSAWGICDKSCHEGLATRTRSIVEAPYCGGGACPVMESKASCMLRPCDCAHVECHFQTHACTDYMLRPGAGGWSAVGSSNKGSCTHIFGQAENTNSHCPGHDSSGGLCATGDGATCDNGSLIWEFGRWVANTPTGIAGVEYEARQSQYHSTCTGLHTSIRVYHHKLDSHLGHHCKMVGGTCNCRCHRMFLHDYHAGAHTDGVDTCPAGKHSALTPVTNFVECVDTPTGAVELAKLADKKYNPYSCDNTNPDVSQPLSIPGKRHMAGLEAWSCKKDDSKYDFGFSPAHHTPLPTPSPTASPTQNDCADGTHHCDATNGFCLMTGHSSYTCGCNTNYVLLGDLRTCVFQSGVNRL
jgi:hypothetical protein